MTSKHFLTVSNMSKAVIEAEYAVRGTMSIVAAKISKELKEGKKFPFTEITECNIGNPQVFGQAPFTYNRQVLSAVMNPGLLSTNVYHKDVLKRAEGYLNEVPSGLGAYSDSQGFKMIRENIARFIEKRDGIPSNPENIYLTDGASIGLSASLQTILASPNDGVMLPIPQYPLYTALLSLNQAQKVPYYLNEKTGWRVTTEDLQRSYDEAKQKGINVRALVVINPGNPTGQVLTASEILTICEFASKNRLVILGDEVYQKNIYKEGAKFTSFKKVVAEEKVNVDLISFHSTSKGLMGECGVRGGYFELYNIDSQVQAQITKLRTMYLCPNTTGQILTDLMVKPPTAQDTAPEVYEQFKKEEESIFKSLKYRAEMVTKFLQGMKGVTCNQVEGAMYAFPRIHLPPRAIEEAKARNISPDLLYTMEVLENTGIVLVPGSGFLQEPGTYHFRITTLILPEEKLRKKMEELHRFNDRFHERYGGSGFSGSSAEVLDV
jgi:alanine transaminase